MRPRPANADLLECVGRPGSRTATPDARTRTRELVKVPHTAAVMVYAVIEPVVREEVAAPATTFTGIKFIQIKQSVTVSTACQIL